MSEAKERTRLQKALAWLDYKGRREGWLAFILMRLTGMGLVLYLLLHFYMLRQLLIGEAAYNAFIETAHTPFYLSLDAILIFGLVFHGLNGLRVVALGFGYGTKHQARLFWWAFALTMLLTVAAMWGILTLA